jgi:hypothetical protein
LTTHFSEYTTTLTVFSATEQRPSIVRVLLAIKAESSSDWKLLAEFKETFQESELPFRVDVLDWNDIAESFRKAIEINGYECLK